MSGPSPTAQQAAALAARCSPVVLGAGAGCGKTTVLVNRFLDQLDPQLGGSPLGKVVAITFTKAAAAEMRARLRKGCADRAAAAVGADAGHWAAVTRELDTARVSTIHGFCGGILRSFAVEAGLWNSRVSRIKN
ncbi:MAG: UvrD-helicase domain-containing protein [Planctomycetota bacterium]